MIILASQTKVDKNECPKPSRSEPALAVWDAIPAPGLQRIANEVRPAGMAATRRRQQKPPECVPFPGCRREL